MNYMDMMGGFPPGFEVGGMPQPQQSGGLFGAGPPPQASQLPGVTQMPTFGATPLQGMGLQSPFMTERPQQGLPTQGFMPTRDNAMGPNAMSMMGMNPNFGNMVGPTSALPPEMQPQASQLKMWGMEDQMAQPPGPQQPGGGGQTNEQAMIDAMLKHGALVQNPTWRDGQYNLGVASFLGSNPFFPKDQYMSPYTLQSWNDAQYSGGQ